MLFSPNQLTIQHLRAKVNAIPGTTTRRLASWKEIAVYLGRDVRTVIRWEKERGLPVHRDSSGPGRPTVHADADELDRWLMGHSEEAGTLPAETPADIPQFVGPLPASRRHYLRLAMLAIIFLIGTVLAARLLVGRAVERHLEFARADFPAAGPMSVGIADFDRDGYLDVAFTNAATDTVDIIFGDGKGAFPRRLGVPSAKEPERLAIDDFNHDGIPDLAVTHRNSHDVTVLLGSVQGSFRESFRWGTGGRSRWVTAADLNGDKVPDLVIACSAAPKLMVMLGRGDGTFDRIHEYDTEGEPSAALVGQFSRDNIPDVVTADYQVAGGQTVSLYAGTGDGTLHKRQPFRTGFGPLAATTADFNHDGLADIATADFHDGLSVLLATADGFAPPRSQQVASAPGFVASGDFDGDGDIDLLLVAEHSNDAHLYYGNGRGDFNHPQLFVTGGYPDSIAVADFNKDGRLDFVVGAVYGNLVSVYLNRTPRQP
jgi:hypothetical protein